VGEIAPVTAPMIHSRTQGTKRAENYHKQQNKFIFSSYSHRFGNFKQEQFPSAL